MWGAFVSAGILFFIIVILTDDDLFSIRHTLLLCITVGMIGLLTFGGLGYYLGFSERSAVIGGAITSTLVLTGFLWHRGYNLSTVFKIVIYFILARVAISLILLLLRQFPK